MVAEVIQIQASPIMKPAKSKAVDAAAAEQQTRDRFTAPRLAELDTHGSDLDSPMDGPSDPDSATLKAMDGKAKKVGTGRQNRGGGAAKEKEEGGGKEEAGEGGGPSTSPAVAAEEQRGGHSRGESGDSRASSTSRGTGSGAENFALTPPAVVVGSLGSTSRNLRGRNSGNTQQPRGVRMRMNVEPNTTGLGKSAAALSTTAPPRSDAGFALFVKQGIDELDELFEMDAEEEELGDVVAEGNSINRTGIGLSSLQEESMKEDPEEDDDEEGEEWAADLTAPMRMKLSWAPAPETKRTMMSQSYAHPAASDWWDGADDLTDSSDEENDDAFQQGDAGTSVSASSAAADSEVARANVLPPPTKRNDAFYGSSMPVAIPSMGGRGRR